MTPLHDRIPDCTFCCLKKSVTSNAYGTMQKGQLLFVDCYISKYDYKLRKIYDNDTDNYFIFDVDTEYSKSRARLAYKNEVLND